MSFSDARANFRALMDRVISGRAPVLVTRQKAEPVVMVSLADWNALAETVHLLSTPANAARLRGAIDELDSGKGKLRDLAEA